MEMTQKEWEEWDDIKKTISELDLPEYKRNKTTNDKDGNVVCCKCGATENINNCIDCVSEKEYTKSEKMAY